MRFRYAVTWESPAQAPVTLRGEVDASNPQAGSRLAVKDARSKANGKRWSSMCLVLEKADGTE